jgi:tetratricopeptide (TPR) repeat protein
MSPLTDEELKFMTDRISPLDSIKGVTDYDLEKQLSRLKMKMNFMNGVIGWVDKDFKLHLMGKDSRILNGKDRTNEIIAYLKSQGYTDSPGVPVYENKSNKNTIIMSHEFLRMQKLSGVITEGEYNQKIEELNSAESSTETLNENVVGIGATLNPYPTKKKEVYESAFSKFLGEEKEGELEEGGDYYEGPVDEDQEEADDKAKKALDKKEDELDKSEEDNESLEDRIKHHEDAIKNIKKELADLHKDLGEDEDDKKEEEKEKKGEVDEAVETADEALKKHREQQLDEVPADRKGVKGYDTKGPETETEREIEDEDGSGESWKDREENV